MSQTLSELIEQQEDTLSNKFLTFSLDKDVFGIEIKFVTEIIGIQPITVVPEVPDYVKGIINLRGQIIPVIDMRLRFKKEAIEYNDRTCIVVVSMNNILIGMIVDSVADVLTISEDNIVPPPNYKSGFQNRYIRGIGKVGNDIKMLLDCDKIITENDMESIETIN